MNFQTKLDAIVEKNNSLLCIGLDSAIEKIPPHLRLDPFPQFAFNKAIIDATHDLVCAYKPNSAFYEAYGSEGIRALKMTCDYTSEKYPDTCLILDAKRADIGSTNEAYVQYAFDYLGVDAITLHPYLGREALEPFLERKDKGCIILCRTSNKGAGEIQERLVDGNPLYLDIAKIVINDWNKNNNCLLVIGATYPEELKQIRDLTDDMTFLVPGVGSQGGNIESTVKSGLNSKGRGLILTVSRSIIFFSNKEDIAQVARHEAEKSRDMINQYRD